MAKDTLKLMEVKSKVSIPMYFYNVILPQRSDYYSDYTVDFDAKPVVKCPLHDEDTPSMRFYDDTNTFYCFGCRAGGDVIQLHRLFIEQISGDKPSFNSSIDFLYDFFIKGNETVSAIKTTNKSFEDKQLSTQAEILRYSNYSSMLESQIMVDTSISCDSKKAIWKALDTSNILISKNEVNAIDAIAYIKNVVKSVI